MDKLTAKKIIELNLKKKFDKKNYKELETIYNNFIDNFENNYKLRICKKFSICDTPTIELSSKKVNDYNKMYYWLSSEGVSYLKDSFKTIIGNSELIEKEIFEKL